MAVIAAAGPAFAADAEDLIAQGLKLRKDGHDQDALPLFRRAYEQQATPRAAGQLGTCEQAMGLWVGAEKHLQEALNHPQDPWVQKNDGPLHLSLAYVQQRLGSIEVWGSPAGARVNIDGDAAGTLPMQPARVAVGRRAVTVEATGFLVGRLSLDVLPGALVREHVALQPVPAPLPSTPTDGGGAPNPLILPVKPDVPNDPPPVAGTDFYKTWWFWTAVGVVAVAAGATIYLVTTGNSRCESPMGGTCTTF